VNLCVIPARVGSKRINKKNIKNFLGKPIIAYSIETAINSKLFDKVIVSTDDKNIAKIANSYGAETPFMRPKELSDDLTIINDVIKHSISWLQDKGLHINYVCCIFATAPFIKESYLRQGLELLRNSNQSFAFSVTSFPFPVQRAFKINDNNISMLYPEHTLSRSQDLAEAYHDAGQFYWGRPQAFLDGINMFSKKSIPIMLPRYLVQDIDTIEDWRRAELMYKTIDMENLNE